MHYPKFKIYNGKTSLTFDSADEAIIALRHPDWRGSSITVGRKHITEEQLWKGDFWS